MRGNGFDRKHVIGAPNYGYPTFEEAQFRAFVRGQGDDRELVYVTRDDLILRNGKWYARRVDAVRARSRARLAYDGVAKEQRGVALTGRCVLNDAICVLRARRLIQPDDIAWAPKSSCEPL